MSTKQACDNLLHSSALNWYDFFTSQTELFWYQSLDVLAYLQPSPVAPGSLPSFISPGWLRISTDTVVYWCFCKKENKWHPISGPLIYCSSYCQHFDKYYKHSIFPQMWWLYCLQLRWNLCIAWWFKSNPSTHREPVQTDRQTDSFILCSKIIQTVACI